VVVLLVLAEVLGEVKDSAGEDGDLDFGRARVVVAPTCVGDDLLLGLC
jgi:hypothetical protein